MSEEPRGTTAITWRWVGDFLLEVVSDVDVSDSDWSALLETLNRNRSRVKGVLVWTKGGTPSARQRSQLRDILDAGSPVRAAVLTESKMVRVALTALNLFLENEARPRPFTLEELDDALAHLQLPRESWPQCHEAIMEMQRELGIARAIR